jgi:glycine/D-amino acid oxidase-like deaminating enzyme
VVRPDGLVLAGATVEPEAGFDRRNTAAGISVLTRNAIRLVPGLANSRVVAFDAGLRPGTPDGRPIIGYVPGFDGLIAATGHYCTGVTFTPITAQIVAELILQGSTNADLTMCQPGRF